ncbi:MAG: DUF4124 domain-containing protein [Pseudomonadota bacterium]
MRWIRCCAVGGLLLALGAPAAYSAMYKWIDANGKVQYSQTPPPEGQFKELKPGPPPVQPAEAQKQLQDLLQKQDEVRTQRDTDKKEKEDKATEQARLAVTCARAKRELALLENNPGRRIGITGDDGQMSRMTEQEREVRLAEARKIASETCKDKS